MGVEIVDRLVQEQELTLEQCSDCQHPDKLEDGFLSSGERFD